MTDIWTNERARTIAAALAVEHARSEADIYTGAVRVGLSRYRFKDQTRVLDAEGAYQRMTAADWEPTAPTAQLTAVTVDADDLATATAISDAWGVHIDRVFSKALCTGLEALAGVEAYVGPFEAA